MATILVVEDDRALAEVLTYNLTQAGYDVLVASDGQDRLTQAQLKLPDIVGSNVVGAPKPQSGFTSTPQNQIRSGGG